MIELDLMQFQEFFVILPEAFHCISQAIELCGVAGFATAVIMNSLHAPEFFSI